MTMAEGENDKELSLDELHPVDDEPEADQPEGDSGEAEGEDAEVVITIGEEAPPTEDEETASAPEWVRELRKSHRQLQREKRELEEKLKAKEEGVENKPTLELAPKPTLETCDYDSEEYEKALEDWYTKKRLYDEAQATEAAKREAEAKAWTDKLEGYQQAKAKLKVKDFEEAEDFARETLNVTQQGIIIQGSDNPAMLIYALGKNPAKAKELASIVDPVKYAFAVAKLETQLKVTNRKAPPPERTLSGSSGAISGSVDSTLERLRAEAEKTGDYTKVIQYRNQKRRG